MEKLSDFGILTKPIVVIYRYKRFGIFNCRGITIVHEPMHGDFDIEKAVSEKTKHKKITILDQTLP